MRASISFFLAHRIVIVALTLEIGASLISSLLRVVAAIEAAVVILLRQSARKMHNILWHSDRLKKEALTIIITVVVFLLEFGEVLGRSLAENWMFYHLLTIGSFSRIDLDHLF